MHRFGLSGVAAVLVSAGVLAGCGTGGSASSYPQKPVELVVPYKPGGGFDRVARPLVAAIPGPLGQPMNVTYIDGAAGAIGSQHVAKARPDGYTLLIAGDNQLAIDPFKEGAGYQPDDLVPVVQLTSFDTILVTRTGQPYNNFDELVTFARANPGKLRYATEGPGSQEHLQSEALFRKLGIRLTMVPFASGSQGVAALLAGNVDLHVTAVSTAQPYLESGKAVGLLVYGAERNPAVKDLPSMTDVGHPELGVRSWRGILAPKGTSAQILTSLEKTLRVAAKDAAFVDVVTKQGESVSIENSATLTKEIQKEAGIYRDLLIELGLTKQTS